MKTYKQQLIVGAVLFILVFLMMKISSAQDRATLKQDTIYYQGEKFYVGKTVRIGYGSNNNKSFAFIAQGVGAIGFNPMLASYSKYDAIIDKVYVMRKKAYFRAKMDGAGAANNIVVDVEGAIDNKELFPE